MVERAVEEAHWVLSLCWPLSSLPLRFGSAGFDLWCLSADWLHLIIHWMIICLIFVSGPGQLGLPESSAWEQQLGLLSSSLDDAPAWVDDADDGVSTTYSWPFRRRHWPLEWNFISAAVADASPHPVPFPSPLLIIALFMHILTDWWKLSLPFWLYLLVSISHSLSPHSLTFSTAWT